MNNQDLINKYPTQDDIDGWHNHHSPSRHSNRNEEILEECPYGKCKLIDNEYVELCELCERDEQLHYETINGNKKFTV